MRQTLAVVAGAFVHLGLVLGVGGALWPEVLPAFGVSKGEFGLFSGLGIALAFPILFFGGSLTDRYDKRTLLMGAMLALLIAALGFAFGPPGVAVFAILMLIRAVGVALIDLANNAIAMDYEWSTGSHVMSGLHGGFSAGSIAGAILVAIVVWLNGSWQVVYGIVAVLSTVALAVVWWLRRRQAIPSADQHSSSQANGSRIIRDRRILLFAVITGLAFAGEGIILEWVAVHLDEQFDAGPSYAARAVAAFGVAMLIGRLANRKLLARIGSMWALILQSVLAFAGGILLVLDMSPWLPIAGSFLGGLGFGGMAPIVLSLAGLTFAGQTGAASGITLAGGYLGLASAPILGGTAATLWSTTVTMAIAPATAVAVLLLAPQVGRVAPVASTTPEILIH